MNERLKQIADEVGFGRAWYDPTIPTSDTDRRWIDQERLRNFSAAIIKDCIAQCTRVEEDTELSDYEGGFRDGALLCRQGIKEHFGIEE